MNHTQRTQRGQANYLPLKRNLRINLTPAEKRMWAKLRGKQLPNLKFRRQHGIGPYIVDCFCPSKSIVIEIDGDVHAEPLVQDKDSTREKYLLALGLTIIRYTNEEVLKNIDGVFKDLLKRLSEGSTSPSPSLQRRGFRWTQRAIHPHNSEKWPEE